MNKERIQVVSAAIMNDGKYLITQRAAKAVLPHLWEFPGGKIEADETKEAALKRELKERLGVDVEVHEVISHTEKEYDKYIVELSLFACSLVAGQEPQVGNIEQFTWASTDELENFEFTPADQQSMDALLGA
jgi:8-oxo-dGTP diphosphatase